MCGFVGFWGSHSFKNYDLENTAKKMAAEIAFRGPDSTGCWVDAREKLALAHQRLSILDVSSKGAQPMVSSLGRYITIYNGEIYNAPELRSELIELGYTFRGTSDTEVLLACIEEWGLASAVRRFIGMFAFAVWDREQRVLALVRDRLGIKPLYHGKIGKTLFFGSQLRAFWPHPEWQGELNLQALESYFHLHYIPAPLSIFQNIEKQLPGTIIYYHQDGRSTVESYWDLRTVSDPLRVNYALNPQEAVEQLHHLLTDSIKKRLISDVPIGAFLSGGIDSSLVVSIMQSLRSDPVKTFSVKFLHQGYDESPFAKTIAAHLGTDHHTFEVSPQEAQSVIPHLAEWFDEPFADVSEIPTYLIAKLARQYVTVSLSGDGGDEVFGGYYRYKWSQRFWRYARFIPFIMRRKLGHCAKFIATHYKDVLDKKLSFLSSQGAADKILRTSEIFMSAHESEMVQRLADQGGFANNFVQGLQPYRSAYEENTGLSGLALWQYCDMRSYLPDDILTKVDRATMASSLEGRVPLLDHRIVEWSWRLPASLKIHHGVSKWPLQKILEKYVPKEYFDRPKMGFNVPLAAWLRTDLKDWAQAFFESHKHLFLNHELLKQQWIEHQSGQCNMHNQLWAYLMFCQWYEFAEQKSAF